VTKLSYTSDRHLTLKVKITGKTEIFYFDLRCDPASIFTTDVSTKKVIIHKGQMRTKNKIYEGFMNTEQAGNVVH
jgi:hypothetical protein